MKDHTVKSLSRPRSFLARWTSVPAIALLAACAGPVDGGRSRDGLLESEMLQSVVDAAIERDTASLAAYLSHADPQVRARAAFHLASLPGAVPKDRLVALLDDDDPGVRADAAFALGRMADTLSTAQMVRELDGESDPRVRLRLIEAAGNTGGRGAAALLLTADLRDSEQPQLALALARLGHRGVNNALAVRRLFEMTGSDDARVRRNAAYYFGRSGSSTFWIPVAAGLRERLDATAPDDDAAAWLLLALVRLGDPADRDRILSWLANGADWRSRYAAATALRPRVEVPEVLTGLFGALDDPSGHVRVAAADALTSASSWSSEQVAFTRVWIDENAEDWRTGGVLLAGLARLARDGDADVRAWLARHEGDAHPFASGLRALGGVPGGAATSTLLEATATEGAPAAAALETLASRWPTEDPALASRYYRAGVAALRSGDVTKVNLAAALLSDPAFLELGAAAEIASAFEAMSASGRAESATTLLARLATSEDPVAEATLRRALEHPSALVRLTAAGALEELTGSPVEGAMRQLPVDRTVDWPALAELGPGPRVVLETELGEIAIELDAEQAPLTVQSFARLARDGAFDGIPFHRVVPFFVIQGGDVERGDGYGNSGFRLRTEATRIDFHRGTVGMASAGRDTEGSQFFITHVLTPHLDGAYTAFGRVVAGQDVVDRIQRWHRVRATRVETGVAGGG